MEGVGERGRGNMEYSLVIYLWHAAAAAAAVDVVVITNFASLF